MKNCNHPRSDLTCECTGCSTERDSASEDDVHFFKHRPDRSFRIRSINDDDLEQAAGFGYYYDPPLPGMFRIVIVRKVYTGVFIYAVSQVINGSNLNLSDDVCRRLYMAVATPDVIERGNDMETYAQAFEKSQGDGKEHD